MKIRFYYSRKNFDPNATVAEYVAMHKFVPALQKIGDAELVLATRPSLVKETQDVAFFWYPQGISFAGSKDRIRDMVAKLSKTSGIVYIFTGDLCHTVEGLGNAASFGNSLIGRERHFYVYARMKKLLDYIPPWIEKYCYVGHRRVGRLGRIRRTMPGPTVLHGNSWWKSAAEINKIDGLEIGLPVEYTKVAITYQKYAGAIHVTEKKYDEEQIVCARLWEVAAANRPAILWSNVVHDPVAKSAMIETHRLTNYNGTEIHRAASASFRQAVIQSKYFMDDEELERAFRRELCGIS